MPPPILPGKGNILLILVATSLLLVSLAMLFHSINTYRKGILALQYKMADATVVKVEEHFEPLGISREVQLHFQVKGQEQRAVVAMPADRVMKKGELSAIFYDENNPENAALTKDIDYDSIIVMGAFGLFLFCFGALLASKLLAGRKLV